MFYFRYAARNLWRNRRWSAFAVFSIAAGVATIVALRSLGLAIGDSLTGNVRASNHGDIMIQRGTGGGGFSFGPSNPNNDQSVMQPEEVQAITAWAEERGGAVSPFIQTSTVQVTAIETVTAGRPQFIIAYFIDPHTYPLTQDIIAQEPAGVPVGALFEGGNEVVISRNLADSQRINVGDRVRVSGTTDEFIVRGIVPTDSEAGFDNLFAAFFGFAYFDTALAEPLSLNPSPNSISVILPEDRAPRTIDEAEAVAEELRGLLTGNSARITTVPQLIERNQTIADITGRFIVVMGLGAMLIGGVGIVNTMLVMVRRRTEEVAALKTFGLKGRQVAALFMAEALLLGLVGSVAGAVIGVFLSIGANAYGETLIQQPLAWRLHPEALVFGLALGLIVTAVFGVMPVLTAVRIRPGIILRPNETHIPAAGVVQSIGSMLFVVVALGLIAGQIMGNLLIGLIAVTVTIILLGVLVGVLWVLVWLMGLLPSFGSVDLRLALRNLRARRIRTATTLLALSAGMFALSSITFFGAGVREILQQTLSGSLGGNVLILSVLPGTISNPIIDRRLDSLDGVISRTRILNYDARVVGINGQEIDTEGSAERLEEIMAEMQSLQGRGLEAMPRISELAEEMQGLMAYNLSISVRDTTGDNIGGADSIVEGRGLTPADRGQAALVIEDSVLTRLGVPVGSTLTLEVDRQRYEMTIVGRQRGSSSTFGSAALPPGVLPSSAAGDFSLNLADVRPDALDNVLLELSSLPLVFSIDITFIDGLLRRFIDQFSALPILVGLLSLGAAAVIMANTVALATLERRRQIGILKAVGLKGRRVLGVMLLENILVSLVGAVLGIGLSALILTIASLIPELGLAEMGIVVIPAEAVPVALALVIGAVLIGAVATFLSAQVAIGERALNVLRYE